jgi:alpha-methylacyl-CoA racemase
MQPLSGITVLDFTTLLPGPLATLMLAEAGAEVIKIERPGGEDMRHYAARWEGESAAFALLNRNKKSLILDLKNSRDQAQIQDCFGFADILVEQFRPGVMERLGYGYETLRAINPRLIYCSITGYGQSGPRAGEAGHDLNYIGHTGLLSLHTGAGAPTVPPMLAADIGGGTYPAVINILLALRRRDATGEGCHLDIAIADAMFSFAIFGLADGQATGRYPGSGEHLLAGGSPRYQLYPTSDGRLVACGSLEQQFWLSFSGAIGLDQKFVDDRPDPLATKAAVASIIAQRSADDWRPVLDKANCCATIVATLDEATRDPHFVARGLFRHSIAGPSGARMPALPLPIAPLFRADPDEPKRAPGLAG